MRTPAARAQLAQPAEPYATCLTDAEWATRLLLEAIFYVLRTGCAWRLLPRDFPPWQTVLQAASVRAKMPMTDSACTATP